MNERTALRPPQPCLAAPRLAEPYFEAPPRMGRAQERRLTGQAAAVIAAGSGAHAFRDNAVTLVCAADGILTVATPGAAVAAAFGLSAGPLARDDGSLGAALGEACDRARAADQVTPFEAVVATRESACALLRGVALPTAAGAEAVLSWKQVLDDDATARLRAELLRALRPRDGRVTLRQVFA